MNQKIIKIIFIFYDIIYYSKVLFIIDIYNIRYIIRYYLFNYYKFINLLKFSLLFTWKILKKKIKKI